ncbi:MAG: glycosyltransferase [Bacteriovoracaceae bacterium]|nr:glycosyltransferase [Bacteriovoracaceae bacterium]
MLDFTISLVVYNPNFEDLNKLFHSISLQKDVSFEILVWDNSFSRNKIEYPGLNISYEKEIRNLGYGSAHNRNFKRAKESSYFFVVNPDIYFEDPYFLKKIKERMDAKPEIGLSSVRLLNPDGSTQDMHRLLPSLWDIAQRFIFQKLKIYKPETHPYTLMYVDKTKDFICPSIGGSFMVFRRDLFEQLGGFDEGIFLYFEDIDLSRRCHFETNGTNTVFGELTAYHAWGRAGYKSMHIFKIHMLSTAYYFQKYGVYSDHFMKETNERLS